MRIVWRRSDVFLSFCEVQSRSQTWRKKKRKEDAGRGSDRKSRKGFGQIANCYARAGRQNFPFLSTSVWSSLEGRKSAPAACHLPGNEIWQQEDTSFRKEGLISGWKYIVSLCVGWENTSKTFLPVEEVSRTPVDVRKNVKLGKLILPSLVAWDGAMDIGSEISPFPLECCFNKIGTPQNLLKSFLCIFSHSFKIFYMMIVFIVFYRNDLFLLLLVSSWKIF